MAGAELLAELLDHWEREYTEVVIANVEPAGFDPEARLVQAARLIADRDLVRFDLAFRAWAQTDPEVLKRVNHVYALRRSWIREVFRELGFKGAELEMRTRLFVLYHSWESFVFPELSKEKRKRSARRRIELLTRP